MQNANKTRGTGPLGGAGMVGLWGASSLIKSRQSGTVTIAAAQTAGTGTITAVDTANSVVRFLGYKTDNSSAAAAGPATTMAQLVLTNSTTLTATRNTADATYAKLVNYEVIEFMPGTLRSVQRGSISISAATSATATITAVDVNKSLTSFMGNTNTYTTQGWDALTLAALSLTNGTTVTASIANAGFAQTVPFEVVEFF